MFVARDFCRLKSYSKVKKHLYIEGAKVMRLCRKDIAKLAGVSEQTVSYILNGTRSFSEETINKVMKVVKETGYKPDGIAKGLAKKHLNIVAILIDNFSNPVYSEILDGFQQEAYKSGYVVVVADLRNRGKDILSDLVSMRVAGVYITLGMVDTLMGILSKLENNDIKIVFGNKIDCNGKSVVYVETNKKQIMSDAVNYLADCGHRDIVYFSGLDTKSKNDERYIGFKEACLKRFGKEGEVFENESPYNTDMESGKRIAKKFLSSHKKATAVITTNDLMAIGVLHEFYNSGIRVPEDISVMGIDDIDIAKYTSPSLTTVSFDKKEYGRTVFRILINQIENKEITDHMDDFKTEIIERSSVIKL